MSIAGKIGSTPQTLLNWVRQHEHDTCQREGVSTAEAKQVKELEREKRQLHRANEILKLASAFCACSQTTGPEGSGQGRTRLRQCTTSAHPADQEAIANRAHSNREGHGDPSLGEGWKYRGRGLKQLTWKGNYQSFQDNYRNVWPDESPDFINNPDLLVQPKYAVRSAVYFWLHNKLYEIADKGATDANVNSITAVINKDTDSYAARRSHFKRIWDGEIFEPVGN